MSSKTKKKLSPALALLLCLSLGSLLSLAGCSEPEKPKNPTYQTGLAATEIGLAPFTKLFPFQYETYENNRESSIMTEYKGSIPYHKNDKVDPLPKGFDKAQPYLKNLWAGYPFMYEYNEARGHVYAIQDILHIDRINNYSDKAGLPATCWNCKTTKIPGWVNEYGDKFWAMNFHDFRTKDKVNMSENSITCAQCHNPQDMTLAIVSIPLAEALERSGEDWRKAGRNDMRSLVCAQCHVEYYFMEAKFGPAKKPVFPWDMGKDPEQIYEYYKTHGIVEAKGFEGQFADWVHPVSKIPMLKVQHPEFETWYNGTHGAAGVACADCHMPYTRMDGKNKISNHQWTSPLKTPDGIDRACRQCHTDKTAEELKARVVYTQKKTYEQLLIAQDLSVKAHEAVRLANEWTGEKNPDYENLLIEAKENVRKGQFFWDYVSAENSVGFHNPAKSLETLAYSQQYSQKGIDAAMQATNYGIGKSLEGDIHKIVPPIQEWTREMQMVQANLDSHPWTKYLPLLPKTERYWDGQEKVAK